MLRPGSTEAIDSKPILDADWSVFSKSISRFGERDASWGELAPDNRYDCVLIGLQLVDRKGPVPGMELAAFRTLLDGLTQAHGWELELGDDAATLKQAAELDALCAEVDFQINLALVAVGDKPFIGTRIRALLEANGLQVADDGVFQCLNDAGSELFSLKNRGATPLLDVNVREFSTRGLLLSLDVPRAPRDAFSVMRAVAGALRDALQGVIVDEQGHDLDEAALDRVDAQLGVIRAQLEGNGIVPGSDLALRLFA